MIEVNDIENFFILSNYGIISAMDDDGIKSPDIPSIAAQVTYFAPVTPLINLPDLTTNGSRLLTVPPSKTGEHG